ncbi:MAG: hypothetical protein IOB84_13480 [Brevundimonas sp.]|nr:hypothetical protein [Brevundimonas sp.]
MTINAALFAEAGEVLFGRDWRRAMSRELNIAERTVNRIAAAAAAGTDYPVNPNLGPEIARLLRNHAAGAEALARKLE